MGSGGGKREGVVIGLCVGEGKEVFTMASMQQQQNSRAIRLMFNPCCNLQLKRK
jgi:hypothetical protein